MSAAGTSAAAPVREDFRAILEMVRPGARVLDVGCGEGELLELLGREKGCDGRGVEISPSQVAQALSRGLSVVQGDADRDLDHFPTDGFDYAVLSQTLPAVRDPRHVLGELLRIAERAVVSIPNFGCWRVRWSLLARGRMPVTGSLSQPWWSTTNIHLCTLRDFVDLTDLLGLRIEAAVALGGGRAARGINPRGALENWRAEQAVFLLRRAEGA